ncbi:MULTISPECIES: 23S rRNA (adenine(1618)-N(6))-methyltransferase RlmF [unclassified Cobetia]|uniref:23S rRNA (adenine(1618)-N(6))-methyltransferase RlmF n=1 Tax=unclassified Cobetia TaxID=2609414 RepID=UPI00178CC162|nr:MULTISPECIES: 23S rRNA (adenine(1618)-N(6))-methyltransferase RlmF [unclassified Cobetia]MBE2167724.1 23S rRNA (adenine(1618)-N(6))-methyltransferase RlmF [Cobetia sp. 2AS1]MDH2446147.1 23S rRNA (adenine(1618)-N(6))-methyltransferase RlmF [Cobetia sp. 2AS]
MSSSSRRPRGAPLAKSGASPRHDSADRRQQAAPAGRRDPAAREKPSAAKAPSVQAPAIKLTPARKGQLHPRNPHRGRYDMAALVKASPALAAFVIKTPAGSESIDFADPVAVKALNRALLSRHYGIAHWDIPAGYLCPPIPGRADYLHYLADLISEANGGQLPAGEHVRALDIGTGANLIYPLLGNRSFGWQMVGSDISAQAIDSARAIVSANVRLKGQIEVRLQADRTRHFAGIWGADERFDLVLCNPPFHASEADMARESQRKWRGLDKSRRQRGNASRKGGSRTAPALNFAGQAAELWCPGGEESFVTRMIQESRNVASQCLWFTSLVAHSASLTGIRKALKRSGASEVRVIEMSQGQKVSRFVAWSYLTPDQRRQWGRDHWQGK